MGLLLGSCDYWKHKREAAIAQEAALVKFLGEHDPVLNTKRANIISVTENIKQKQEKLKQLVDKYHGEAAQQKLEATINQTKSDLERMETALKKLDEKIEEAMMESDIRTVNGRGVDSKNLRDASDSADKLLTNANQLLQLIENDGEAPPTPKALPKDPVIPHDVKIDENPPAKPKDVPRPPTQAHTAAFTAAINDFGTHGAIKERMWATFTQDPPRIYNTIVWHWATCPNPKHANPTLAIEVGKELLAMADTPWYRDTMAAAYARAGQFEQAIQMEEQAVKAQQKMPENSGPQTRLPEMQTHLELYRKHKPFIDSKILRPNTDILRTGLILNFKTMGVPTEVTPTGSVEVWSDIDDRHVFLKAGETKTFFSNNTLHAIPIGQGEIRLFHKQASN